MICLDNVKKTFNLSKMVFIPDLGISNTGAVSNIIKKCGGNPVVTSSPQDLFNANKIILAGVGSFDSGMNAIHNGGWYSVLQEIFTAGNVPILGICLGMQLMCRQSDEGELKGLNWFDADVKKLESNSFLKIKIPHMGWNDIFIKKESSLFTNMDEYQRFYFVHSYHVVCNDQNDVIATTYYGQNITAVINKKKLYGTQFHPEKSHKYGFNLIKSFLDC
jgi:glutamine amidotransferase